LQFISFHANISYPSVQFVERILLDQVGRANAGATIFLCTGGGDSGAGVGLYYLLKSLPYPVHVHAAGMCASGGVSLLAGAAQRTCSPGTHFMLHGSKAPDGSLSPQAGMTRDIFKHALAWDQEKLDYFFSDVSEKWFDESFALANGIIKAVEPFAFPSDAVVHMVPN
jgi:ATP-dependent protease ClpP protease subunit